MRWSQTLIPTLRETPREAEATSHRLMLRAGLIRKLSSGVYDYLPLGLKVLQKVEAILRDEMNRASASEVLLPAMHPIEIWQKTGRLNVMRDILMIAETRGGQKVVFGPTHEEIITELASAYIHSHQDMPRILYQIQTKFRDEPRARFGIIRSKEFIMKDAYSFDRNFEDLDRSYQKMFEAYERIFKRCGLDCFPVEADPGAMGGNISHEFMVKVDFGEDLVVSCSKCQKSWNREVASGKSPKFSFDDTDKKIEEFSTPNISTIDQLVKQFKLKAQTLIKTLIYIADDKPVACLLRGDHELAEGKLKKLLQAKKLQLANEEQIKYFTKASVGFAGPVGLKSVKIVVDHAVLEIKNAVTGANKDHTHLRNVKPNRDFKADQVGDIRYAIEGDLCPTHDEVLQVAHALEMGHVFKLGTRYSDSFDFLYLDEKGQRQKVIMGCYGIGVNRILAAAIEQHHDEKGICWPEAIAPFQIDLIILNNTDENSRKVAEQLYQEMTQKGFDVIYDDRDERAGVKFNDADLIGFPLQVIVGERNLKENCVEVKSRKSLSIQKLAISKVIESLPSLLSSK